MGLVKPQTLNTLGCGEEEEHSWPLPAARASHPPTQLCCSHLPHHLHTVTMGFTHTLPAQTHQALLLQGQGGCGACRRIPSSSRAPLSIPPCFAWAAPAPPKAQTPRFATAGSDNSCWSLPVPLGSSSPGPRQDPASNRACHGTPLLAPHLWQQGQLQGSLGLAWCFLKAGRYSEAGH